MRHLLTIILSLAVLFPAGDAFAQKTIRGTVTDAESGEPLPVAHIRVEGRFQGTITNSNGGYELTLSELPAEIGVTYIGYPSVRRMIDTASPEVIDIALTPNPVVLEEIVVTPEDPAVRIMREVIRRKPIWRKELANWKADAYTRISLANDERIALMAESISEVYWDADAGTEEVIISKRQTENIGVEQNFAQARIMPNLYDDNVTLLEFDMIGVTHPDALNYYDFKLIGQRMRDDKRVYDISVPPKKKLQPSFVGTVSVLDGDYAMIAIDVKPNDAVMFPPPLNHFNIALAQQCDNFDGDYWLPVDGQVTGTLLLRLPGVQFPPMNFKQLSHLTGYDINIALPDSLFKERKRRVVVNAGASRNSVSFGVGITEEPAGTSDNESPTVASAEPVSPEHATPSEASGPDEAAASAADETSEVPPGTRLTISASPAPAAADTSVTAAMIAKARTDSIFAASSLVVPFSPEEQHAYAEIDSTDNPGEAFTPTGFLVDALGGTEEQPKKEQRPPTRLGRAVDKVSAPFSPRVAFNRVDGGGLGLALNQRNYRRLSLTGTGMYHFASEDWSYGAGLDWRWGRNSRGVLGIEYAYGSEPGARSVMYPMLVNSAAAYLTGNDYYDYHHNERWGVRAGYSPRRYLTDVSLKYSHERHTPLIKATNYTLIGDDGQRMNPTVTAGDLRSVTFSARIGDADNVPFGLAMQHSLAFDVEVSDPDLFGGDYRFTRYTIQADWRFETFLRRRFLPNALDIRVLGGYTDGDTVPERFGALDGTIGVFSPFGSFRTLRSTPMEGTHYAAIFWEHNFRTVPFELMGMQWLVEKGVGVVLHGASGRTWRGDGLPAGYLYANDAVRHEIGLSVNGIFGFLRADLTKRLDKSGWFGGFGLARIL